MYRLFYIVRSIVIIIFFIICFQQIIKYYPAISHWFKNMISAVKNGYWLSTVKSFFN